MHSARTFVGFAWARNRQRFAPCKQIPVQPQGRFGLVIEPHLRCLRSITMIRIFNSAHLAKAIFMSISNPSLVTEESVWTERGRCHKLKITWATHSNIEHPNESLLKPFLS